MPLTTYEIEIWNPITRSWFIHEIPPDVITRWIIDIKYYGGNLLDFYTGRLKLLRESNKNKFRLIEIQRRVINE